MRANSTETDGGPEVKLTKIQFAALLGAGTLLASVPVPAVSGDAGDPQTHGPETFVHQVELSWVCRF